MKKEEIVSSCVMLVVSTLVLVGFTIAWYTSRNTPVATGLKAQAVALGDVKVALTPGGDDVTELMGDAKYADIGLGQYSNLEAGKLAPGTWGSVTFYVTPINGGVRVCDIVPQVLISQTTDEWYPAEGKGQELEELYELVKKHIQFFSDEGMQHEITEEQPFQLTWSSADAEQEKAAVLYWKWHYEYPFTEEERAILSQAEQRSRLENYDIEDMKLGNNISRMKYYFTFAAQ